MPSKTRRKTFKIGGSLSITLPKDFMEYYEIKKGDELIVIYDGKIIIYPDQETADKDREKVRDFLSEANKQALEKPLK